MSESFQLILSRIDEKQSALDENELCCRICPCLYMCRGKNMPCCQICQDTCTNMVKLPCNHSICKKCLSKWSLVTNNNDNNKDIECPFCRSVILTHSELNFERSYYRNMLEDITNNNVKMDMLCFKQESEYMENCILERTNIIASIK